MATQKPTTTTMKETLNGQNLQMLAKADDRRSLTKKYDAASPAKYPASNPYHLQVKSASMAKTFNASNVQELRVHRHADTSSFRSTLKPNSFMNDHLYAVTYAATARPPTRGSSTTSPQSPAGSSAAPSSARSS